MLHEEVAKYRELSGDTNPDTPISRIGGYLDGYEKALEQEPCEDTISRQAVLESIKNLYPDMPVVDIMGSRRKWLDKYAPYFECENAIERSPSVNPQEPKAGHWITSPNGCFVQCSECGLHGNKGIYKHYRWCPNCGARMIELQEREGTDADSD